MFQWLASHSATISVLVNLGLLLVWFIYLHLFLLSHLRRRRPSILINRGAGTTLDAHCLVSNMSAEPIYLQNVIATLKKGSETWTAAVTDLQEIRSNEIRHASEATNQGPLGIGDFTDLGSFAELAERMGRRAGANVDKVAQDYDALELMVVAAYGPDKYSVAARREFTLDSESRLTPRSVSTEQIRSWRRRRQIDRYLTDRL